jgi:hypothetical protein
LISDIPLTRDKLIAEQEIHNELKVLSQKALKLEEAQTVPVCYYLNQGVLMGMRRRPDAPVDQEWQVFHQIVIPKAFRNTAIGLGHDSPLSCLLGINKTYKRVLTHFNWPKMKRDMVKYCKTCHVCQVVGKPNQTIAPAPLNPTPAFDEPFARVLIDCVGPLPKTKLGNQYLCFH